MAFNAQEQEILRWGAANGKTGQEITDAITRYRLTGSPKAQAPAPTVAEPSGFLAALKDIPSDIQEGFQGAVDEVSRGMDTAVDTRSSVEGGVLSPLAGTAKTIGAGLRAGAGVVGTALLTAGKLFTSPKSETAIRKGVESGAQALAQTPAVKSLVQTYEGLSPDQKATVDGLLGTAEGLATMFGAGPAVRAARTGVGTVSKVAGEATSMARAIDMPRIPNPRVLPADTAGVTFARFFLRPTENQAEALIAQRQVVDVADTAIRYGLWGRDVAIGVKAKKMANDLWKSAVQPAVRSVGTKIYGNEIIRGVESSIRAIKDPVRRAEMRAALAELKEQYGDRAYTLERWQGIKSEIDDITPKKGFKGQEIVSPRVQLNHEFADAIRKFTYDLLQEDDIRRAYLDYANLSELATRGAKTASSRSNSPVTSPYQLLYQTLENLVQPAGTGSAVLLDRVIRQLYGMPLPKVQGAAPPKTMPTTATMRAGDNSSAIGDTAAWPTLETAATQLSAKFMKGGMSEIALREEIAKLVPNMERGLVEDIARDAQAIRESGGDPLPMFQKRLQSK